MSSNNAIPMPVAATLQSNYQLGIWIGLRPNVQNFAPPSVTGNQVWLSVYDRTTLKQVFNYASTDSSTLPSGISQYNNSQFILVCSTIALGTDNLPQGDLYNFLMASGAGSPLSLAGSIS